MDCLILYQEGRTAASMFDTNDPSVLQMDYIYWRNGSSIDCYDPEETYWLQPNSFFFNQALQTDSPSWPTELPHSERDWPQTR
jgi:hypothetical protein